MAYIEWGWQRRRSLLQQSIVLVAGLQLAGAVLLAFNGRDGVGISASSRAPGTPAPRQETAASRPVGQEVSSPASVSADGQRIDEAAEKRGEIADLLRRRGESAWRAGDDRTAGALYRQSWAVMPNGPQLMATDLKRWELAERLQREGNMAWQAGDVTQAASLYHQSQAILP